MRRGLSAVNKNIIYKWTHCRWKKPFFNTTFVQVHLHLPHKPKKAMKSICIGTVLIVDQIFAFVFIASCWSHSICVIGHSSSRKSEYISDYILKKWARYHPLVLAFHGRYGKTLTFHCSCRALFQPLQSSRLKFSYLWISMVSFGCKCSFLVSTFMISMPVVMSANALILLQCWFPSFLQ